MFLGFVWTAFQTVGTKIISLVAQVFLAWLLVPEDFGKISIATSITGIIFMIQNFGLSDVLVSRGKMFDKIYDLTKSISALTAIVCFLIFCIVGFVAGAVYDDSVIKNLILLFSIVIPFNTMSVVSDAKLRIDLRFKELSIVRVCEFFLSQITIILFVLLDFGVYSFVLGPILSSIIRYFWLVKLAHISHSFKPTFHHWTYLFSNSFYGFVHSVCQTIIRQSDYLILALFVSQTEVGIYFMAYSLSVQVIGVLVGSLSPVLFPTLMKIPLQEKDRIKSVLLKITGVFAMLGMPFAFWQASVVKPLILIFFEEKWYDTILLVQILSIGIGFNVVSALWAPALRIQSLFKVQMKFSIISMIVFIVLITPLSYWFSSIGLAIAVSVYYMILSPVLLYFSFRKFDVSLIQVYTSVLKYFVMGAMVFGTLYYLNEIFNSTLMVQLIVLGFAAPSLYFFFLWRFDKNFDNVLKELTLLRPKNEK
ncbi:oligosaccharide flippase family protein [Flavicella marina]|uniref:oligosaccharide flippase family protein n=1 Tax=Flavicella marina TaxID=1475951 RepID=UPI00186AC963|nr:oligosaccharide flippase family protein [Flavicella marina]